MPGLRATSVMVVMGGIVVLTGCQGLSHPPTRSGAPASASSSADTSVVAGTSNGSATTTPSTSATATPTRSHTSASPVGAMSPSRAGALPTSANRPGCHNLTVSNEVKAAVTEAYRRSFPRFAHVQPVPRQFFYGRCGDVRYAATRFESTPGATHDQLVAMQDEGSATKYFRGASGADWIYIAGDGSPRGVRGCDDVPQIPESLAETWGNCSVGRLAPRAD